MYMDNRTLLIITIAGGLILFLLLPFPVFLIMIIVWGGIWGWIYEGRKLEEEERYYYEDEDDEHLEELLDEFIEYRRRKQEWERNQGKRKDD